MTLMARVSAERAAQSNAAATSSGVKPKRCVMSGSTSTFLLAISCRHSGYCAGSSDKGSRQKPLAPMCCHGCLYIRTFLCCGATSQGPATAGSCMLVPQ